MPMLAPPIPRMKPMLSQQQASQQSQAAPEPFVWGEGGTKMTPADVQRRRQIAAELSKSAGDMSPIQHWTQGLGRIADGVLGALEQRRANEAETEGKAHFADQFGKLQEAMNAPGADKKALIAQSLAAYRDPYADEGSKMMLAPQFTQPEKTDDQREYDAAKAGGFGGSFMDYMTTLRQAGAGQPTPAQRDYQYSKQDPGFVDYQKDLKPPRQVPSGIQSAEDKDVEALGANTSMNMTIDDITKRIDGGQLKLGFFKNLGSQGLNMLGASTPESVEYSTFMQAMKKMQNDILILHNGVQTEGDAQRAIQQIITNPTDENIVRANLAQLKTLNERALQLRRSMIDLRRDRNDMEAFDPGKFGLPGGAPNAPAQSGPQPGAAPLVRTQAEFDALPSGATYTEDDGKTYRKP